MEDNQKLEIKLGEDFDIDEVLVTSDEKQEFIDAGTVKSWKLLEFDERAKVRPYITTTILSVWAVSVVVSVLRLLLTGNFLFAFPPVLISAPLYLIMNFYYRSD